MPLSRIHAPARMMAKIAGPVIRRIFSSRFNGERKRATLVLDLFSSRG
jgi:hypothetical protein